MDGKKQNNTIKTIISIFLKLLDILVKANYHEYPIVDKEGNIIGSEFVTTHDGLLIRPKTVPKDNDKSASIASLIQK
jgi:hypothetical protein